MCTIRQCSNPAYGNFNECVLHCDKNNNSSRALLEDFFRLLEQYVILKIDPIEKNIIFNNIHFPSLALKKEISHDIDYFIILGSLTAIDFRECTFSICRIELPSTVLYFEDCIFKNKFYISDYKNNEIIVDYIFFNCKFNKEVTNTREDNLVINVFLFKDCLFKDDLFFNNVVFNRDFIGNSEKIDYNEKDFNLKILHIDECTFKDVFKLNQYNIDSLIIENSYFLSELEIMNTTIKRIYFNTCSISKIFDSNSSVFTRFLFYKVRFEDFLSFEKVTFGCDKKCVTRFLNNTFEDYSNFRNTEFLSGLDFSTVNLKQAPNFLGAKFHGDSTDRETFRIIKNSFEKISNSIEANRFFVHEMNVYRYEAKTSESIWTRFILWANYRISGFGSNYITPILILVFSIIIYTLINIMHRYIFENKIYISNDYFYSASLFINKLAVNFLPFTRFLEKKQGIEMISLLFYIWFAVLVWQIISAIKRHTQH